MSRGDFFLKRHCAEVKLPDAKLQIYVGCEPPQIHSAKLNSNKYLRNSLDRRAI